MKYILWKSLSDKIFQANSLYQNSKFWLFPSSGPKDPPHPPSKVYKIQGDCQTFVHF